MSETFTFIWKIYEFSKLEIHNIKNYDNRLCQFLLWWSFKNGVHFWVKIVKIASRQKNKSKKTIGPWIAAPEHWRPTLPWLTWPESRPTHPESTSHAPSQPAMPRVTWPELRLRPGGRCLTDALQHLPPNAHPQTPDHTLTHYLNLK